MTTRSRAPRRAAAVATAAMVAATLVACDAGEETPRSERSSEKRERGQTTATQPAPGPLEGLPRAPSPRDVTALADQIVKVERVLRDPDSRRNDLRRAGEFEQLAGRMLAKEPDRVRARLLDRLPPAVRRKTRAHIEAASLLDSMGGPVSTFPDWRIVEPPAPRVLLGHYRNAGRQVGVPWEYLAAVHLVETRMGRIRGVSTAGAQGPMQFLPTTWDIYGEGGDITDPEDAIFAAARLLKANGAPGDMSRALWHYNPSNYYVGAVTRYAQQIQRSTSAYAGYWHWRVLYNHVDGVVVLDTGYPKVPPKKLR